MTLGWGLGAAVTFAALCSVPFLVHLQLQITAARWAQQRTSERWLTRLRYRAAQAWALLTGLTLGAWGASYLYLVAVHCGVLQ